MLRLRSDEQLVALFRAGNDEAFRVIHDRYRQRLFAYTRQMLPGSRQDAEDALQDVFVRAYGGLRANDRALALRAWLYRVAHNRCVDELRRPVPPAREIVEMVRPPAVDPIAEAEQRETLRRLIADVRRLPEQQRSALLMRELGGMSYNDIAEALGVSVPAVKSLLVRARLGLAQSAEARDASCADIRGDLIVAHDRGVRPGGMARRHMRDCRACRQFRLQLRSTSRQFAALTPGVLPAALAAKLLGFGGGSFGFGGGGGAAASGGVAAVGTGGGVASIGVLATGAGHMATLLAAAVVTAGGAVEIQQTIVHPAHRRAQHAHALRAPSPTAAPATPAKTSPATPTTTTAAVAADPAPPAAPVAPAAQPPQPSSTKAQGASDNGQGSTPGSQPVQGTGGSPTAGSATSQTDPGAGTTPPGDGASTGTATPTGDGSTPSGDGSTPPDPGATPSSPGATTPTGPDATQSPTTGQTPPLTPSAGAGDSTGSDGSQLTG